MPLSQTLLELRIEAELVEYFETTGERTIGEATLDLLPSYNIGNPRGQRFFERLAGVRLRDNHRDELAALRAHASAVTASRTREGR